MEKNHWLELLSAQTQIKQVLDTVSYTEKFGLILSEEEAKLLTEERALSLKKERRVEFGQSILQKIIYAFCDSSYIIQENYCETLMRLTDIFYMYKNEMADEITDDELLEFMNFYFVKFCFVYFVYLGVTCI